MTCGHPMDDRESFDSDYGAKMQRCDYCGATRTTYTLSENHEDNPNGCTIMVWSEWLLPRMLREKTA